MRLEVTLMGVLMAGQTVAQEGGWRKFSEPAPASTLTLAAGTFISVRVDQTLTSKHNRPGDAFTATLEQPLVAEGLVVARRGQTLGGRVADVQPGARGKGGASLGVELTELSLADGGQARVRTQLMQYSGGGARGRNAAAVVTTAGTGAAIGGMAGGGAGAGIGAAVGAAVSGIVVAASRGRAAEIEPEALLTFRLLEPVTIATERSGASFRPATQEDYGQRLVERRRAVAPPYYAGFGYPWFYTPYYWGPGPYFYTGVRFYHGHGGRRR
ncbi:MAG: hypothetical protein HY858_05495 [Candidatus Solibacter usitatus]|nr:hypothetical protein [Candidatus Solibacter usitatus]